MEGARSQLPRAYCFWLLASGKTRFDDGKCFLPAASCQLPIAIPKISTKIYIAHYLAVRLTIKSHYLKMIFHEVMGFILRLLFVL